MSGMDFEIQDPPPYVSASTELERHEQAFKLQVGLHREYPPPYPSASIELERHEKAFKLQVGLHQEYPPAYETVTNNQCYLMTDIRPQPTVPSPTDAQRFTREQPTLSQRRVVSPYTEDYLSLSILTTICVFLCGGWLSLLCSVAAICVSNRARDDKRHGDSASAQKKSKISLRLNIAAILMMLATWVVVGVVFGLGKGTLYSLNPLLSELPTTSPATTITTAAQTTTTTTSSTCQGLSYPGGATALIRNNLIGVIPGTTGNYRLSFDIVPTGYISEWSSILHFTGTDNNCCSFGDRAPGIWFIPGTTQLHVRIGDSTNGNWGIDTDPLNLYTRATVTLECIGVNVKLTVGGVNVYTAIQPASRFAGDLTVYAADPWYQAANAAIYNVQYACM